jgi:hypothetical protein
MILTWKEIWEGKLLIWSDWKINNKQYNHSYNVIGTNKRGFKRDF